MKKKKSTGTILAALFAALISAGCFIQIPLPGGIPIILQDMLAMLSGMLLGPLYGSIAVFVFLVLGSIGLPVFSGKAGLQVITAGPTGGFLIGYLLGALAAGLFLKFLLPPASAERRHVKAKTYILITAAAVLATVIIFVCGIIGFMRVTGSDFSKTLAAVLIPFIPGNLLKIVLMVPLTHTFRPVIEQYTAV
ncbi:biotin transporter BioY [Treponema sp.]|uniref:biotin transporter BioY n=1 Tax=Treponema sp. TaxID=166 RepID=UPI002356EC98|nr:biotin transporter BioY [Treponema sp.]MCI7114905.1 biotin transporter BioY [Treponema porcinum]